MALRLFALQRDFGLIIAAIWATAVLLSGIYYPHGGTKLNYFYQYMWSVYKLICLIVISVSYMSIVVKFYRGARRLEHHCSASRERKLTITLLIMTFVSLLVYFTLAIFVSVLGSIATGNYSETILETILLWLPLYFKLHTFKLHSDDFMLHNCLL